MREHGAVTAVPHHTSGPTGRVPATWLVPGATVCPIPPPPRRARRTPAVNPSLPPHQQEQLHEEREVPTPLARPFGHFSEGLPPQVALPGDGEVL